jgi:hypothetical protein
MAIFTGQQTIGTAAVVLVTVPPGPGQLLLSNSGTSTVWVGAGTTVSATSGFPLASGAPISWAGYMGGQGGPVAAVCSSGSASVGWLLSRPGHR